MAYQASPGRGGRLGVRGGKLVAPHGRRHQSEQKKRRVDWRNKTNRTDMPPVDGMAGNFGKVLPATTVKSNLGAAAELGRKKQLMW